jgi:hypothetical protein
MDDDNNSYLDSLAGGRPLPLSGNPPNDSNSDHCERQRGTAMTFAAAPPPDVAMEMEIVRRELAAAFALVTTVTPRLLVLEMIEISVHVKTFEKSVGRTTMQLASMKIGEQQQGNSKL